MRFAVSLSFLWLMQDSVPKHILPVIVFAQFAGTSPWFAGNAVVDDLILAYGLADHFIGTITIAVQAGFIIGTLIFAFLNIADRFSPVRVFLACAFAVALANLSVNWTGSAAGILSARFLTGFFLAGIYPVGMKIASDWHKRGLGKALGYLVGALVVGKAFPHLLNYLGTDLEWRYVFTGTSIVAASGGLMLFLTVPDGPYRSRSNGFRFKWNALISLFQNRNFRSAAFGYFGHMWELYTVWAFVPVLLTAYALSSGIETLQISLWSFFIIAAGGAGCAIGGHVSLSRGSKPVALISLAISGTCSLLLPLMMNAPLWLFLPLLLTWGFFVVSDSPQFSTLVAHSSDSCYVATGLTIVNSIGFAITIVSIELINRLWYSSGDPLVFWLIALGPIAGLIVFRSFNNQSE